MIGMKSIFKSAVVISATGALFGCGGGEQQQAAEGALPRQETLYLSGQQWGAPATFNPLAESWMAAWPVGGRFWPVNIVNCIDFQKLNQPCVLGLKPHLVMVYNYFVCC